MDVCQVNRDPFLLMDCWSHEIIKHAMVKPIFACLMISFVAPNKVHRSQCA